MYVYLESHNEGENGESLYTVGFYSPDGKWHPEGDYWDETEAQKKVHYLNGGNQIHYVTGEN